MQYILVSNFPFFNLMLCLLWIHEYGNLDVFYIHRWCKIHKWLLFTFFQKFHFQMPVWSRRPSLKNNSLSCGTGLTLIYSADHRHCMSKLMFLDQETLTTCNGYTLCFTSALSLLRLMEYPLVFVEVDFLLLQQEDDEIPGGEKTSYESGFCTCMKQILVSRFHFKSEVMQAIIYAVSHQKMLCQMVVLL